MTGPMPIWLQTRGNRIVVLVQVPTGEWVEVIDTIGADHEQVVSHCVHSGGILTAIEKARS